MGGSETTTVNQRIIPDATEEENALLQSLYSLSPISYQKLHRI